MTMTSTETNSELWIGDERIVVIEYHARRPFSVITENHWDHSAKPWFKPGMRPNGVSRREYDFEWCRTKQQLYQNNSGGGGRSALNYVVHKVVSGKMVEIWADDDVRFFRYVKRGSEWVTVPLRQDLKALGYRRLKKPRLLEGLSRNPFDVAEEGDTVWCPRCKDHLPTDWTSHACDHLVWCDDCGAWVFTDTREFVESGSGKCECNRDDE